jgi:hypothetical protein
MDYIPGKRFIDCFEELDYDQKKKTATDLALIMSEIFHLFALWSTTS